MAAVKRKGSLYEDSSSEEEQFVAQPIPSHAKTPKHTEQDDDESDSDSGSDSNPDPPTETLNLPPRSLESEDSSDEEDEEEQKKEENPQLPAKEPESKPDKKKLKISDPDQSLSSKSTSAIQRIWSPEDEIAVLRALCEYHSRNGKLPPTKDHASFLSGIRGSIGFAVTEKQLSNKLRQLKHSYGQKIKKGPNVKISKPHEMAVFKMCAKLFEDSSKAFKSGVSVETKKNVGTENHVAASGGDANGGAANGDAVARPNFYLRSLIEGYISGQQCLSWCHTVEDMVAQVGESRLHCLEAKAEMLRIDAIKLQSREQKLIAEFLDTVAEGMADD